MSVSSSLNQSGVWPGMMMTSPLVTRRETPPSIPEPRRLWSREDHEHGEHREGSSQEDDSEHDGSDRPIQPSPLGR